MSNGTHGIQGPEAIVIVSRNRRYPRATIYKLQPSPFLGKTLPSMACPAFSLSELLRFEKWLARSGAWAEQPTLALLTTCGAQEPRGFKAEAGVHNTVEAVGSMNGERLMPSDYPSDEVLAEMVDPYEALLCWYHIPPGGSGSNGRRKFVEDDGTETRWAGNRANGDIDDATRIACFVAYHDQGKPRKVDDLKKKHTEIGTKVHDRRQDTENGASGRLRLSSEGGAIPTKVDDEINANDFKTGPFRVRMILADPGTSEKLRRATEAFLSAMSNRNIVSCFEGIRRRLFCFLSCETHRRPLVFDTREAAAHTTDDVCVK